MHNMVNPANGGPGDKCEPTWLLMPSANGPLVFFHRPPNKGWFWFRCHVLSFSSNHRLLIGELHLGKLSETVVVHGNAPHDRPRFLVSHLIGNRASFLCTKAPMC